ncbi:MAG: tetratricopeptide repeat protein [Bacteroidales bacterium]|nr:tetratricopeptide repeat protein [Bacteroidales bacterium]
MKISLHRLSLLAAGALFGCAMLTASGPKVDVAAEKKAEYIFLEAANARSEERADDYMMLLRRAYSLNPTDPYIGGALAEIQLSLGVDSATAEDAYERIKARFEATPTEPAYYNAYANVATNLDRIDDLIYLWSKLDTLLPDKNDPALYLASDLMIRYMTKRDTADYVRACGIYDRLEESLGPTLPIISMRVRAYSATNDTASIVKALGRLAKAAPADTKSNIFIGNAYEFINNPDSALHYYNRAVEADSTDGDVYIARANFFHNQADSVGYDREVFRALNSPSLEFPQKFGLLTDYVVKLYSDSTQHGRIEQMFQTMQDQNPGEASLHSLYGAYKAETGDMEAAAEQFSYSLDLEPGQHDVWMNLIQLRCQPPVDDKKLFETSKRALDAFPGDMYFTFMGVGVLIRDSLYNEALALLDTADPATAPTQEALSGYHTSRGDIFYALGARDSAYTEYDKAIALDAKNYLAMNNCAYFLATDTLDLTKAELYASIASTGEPENVSYLDTYAWVLYMKKEYTQAREVIDKALALFKKPEDEDGNEDEDAKAMREPSAEVYDHAGDIYFMTGEHKQAVEFWKEALKLEPTNALIRKKVEHKTIFFE